MSQFNTGKWFKNQYLKEANLYENKADLAAKAIDQAIAGVDESLGYSDFAKAVATILKDEYGAHNFGPFMEVLHAELGIDESLNEAKGMETYSVEGDIQDPDGGSDGSFGPVKVQVKAGLKDKDLRMAIKRAAEDEIADRIYKFDYKKA